MAKIRPKNNDNVEIVSDEVKLVSDNLETKLKNNLKSKKDEEVKIDLGEVAVVQVEQPVKSPII